MTKNSEIQLPGLDTETGGEQYRKDRGGEAFAEILVPQYSGVRPRMAETKPELAGVPRATPVWQCTCPRAGGTTRLGVTRLPEGKRGQRSLVAGVAGLGGQHRSAPGQRFQAGGAEDVEGPIRQRGLPDEEVRPRGPMSEEKRSGGTAPRQPSWSEAKGCQDSRRRAHVPTGAQRSLWARDEPATPTPRFAQSLGGARGHPLARRTQRSALGQPGSLDSAYPAPDPPSPRSPRRSSAWARQPLRNITHDGSASVPESRPVLQREDAPARTGPQHAVPVCPRRPASARLVPPAGERSRAAGLWLVAPPCHTGRAPGPIAAAVALPPPQVLPRRGPGRVQRASAGAGSGRSPGCLTRHQHGLCVACVECKAGLDPAAVDAAQAVRRNRTRAVDFNLRMGLCG